jgi:hypothetical protein
MMVAVRSGKFELYVDKKRQFRFRLRATNGQVILASSGYKSRLSAVNGIRSVRINGVDDIRYQRTSTKSGFGFNLLARNKQVIGTSEDYKSARSRDNGIASVARNAPRAAFVDLTSDQ